MPLNHVNRVQCPLSQNFATWDILLHGDKDYDYILDGIKNGFRIVDNVQVTQNVYCHNYKSACDDSVRTEVENQILTELAVGNYV